MIQSIKNNMDRTAILSGIGLSIILYLLLFVAIGLNGEKTISGLEGKLASEISSISRSATTQNRNAQFTRNASGLQGQDSEGPDGPAQRSQSSSQVSANNTPINGIVHDEAHDQSDTSEHIDGEPHNEAAPQANKVYKTGRALPPTPIQGFFEPSPQGILPIVADNKLRPFDVYKKPFETTSAPTIAIAISDFGLNETLSDTILQTLPSEISLIISPYSASAHEAQKQARLNGHEVWIELPMQTADYPYSDAGPQSLLAANGLQYNHDRLEWTLTRTTGYAGIAAFSDSSFNSTKAIIKKLFEDVFSRGLGYFELNPQSKSPIEPFALLGGAPYIKNKIFNKDISFKEIESYARDLGKVTVVIEPSPAKIDSLRAWSATLSAKGIALAPLSALADDSPAQQAP